VKTPRTIKELGLSHKDLISEGNNLHRTGSLFKELYRLGKQQPIWTVKDYDLVQDGITYPSLKELYLECEDPTEYKFAIKVFDSWIAWEKIREHGGVKERFLNRWRKELDVRLVSKGIRTIVGEINKGKGSFNSAKYLIEQGWIKQKPMKKGRPSKKVIATEATKMLKVKDELDEELERAELLIYNK